MKNAPTVMMAAGTAPKPRDTRQPDSLSPAAKKLTRVAVTLPKVRKNWKAVAKVPRHFGGAISER